MIQFTMTTATLRTSEEQGTTSAGDLGILIREEVVDNLWSQGGEPGSYTKTFDVEVESPPVHGQAFRRYGLLEIQGTVNGPVEVVEPARDEQPFPVKIGDVLKIKVTHG